MTFVKEVWPVSSELVRACPIQHAFFFFLEHHFRFEGMSLQVSGWKKKKVMSEGIGKDWPSNCA